MPDDVRRDAQQPELQAYFEPLEFDDEEDEEESAVGESIKENHCPQCAGPLETLPTEAQSKPFRCPLCGGAANASYGHVIWD